MRKLFFLVILFLLLIAPYNKAFSQNAAQQITFRIQDFKTFNPRDTTKTEIISVTSLLDMAFYRQHFFIPYYFPEKSGNGKGIILY